MNLSDYATSIFPHALKGAGGDLYALVLLVIGLGLAFAGRSIVKGLAFLVAGFAGAALGVALGATVLGAIGSIVGGVVGFLIGGFIGILLVELGIGIALGYFGYLVARFLTHSLFFGIVVGIVLFVVGLALSNKLLEAATAAIGALVLYDVMIYFGLSPLLALVVAIVLGVAGFMVQRKRHRNEPNWKRT